MAFASFPMKQALTRLACVLFLSMVMYSSSAYAQRGGALPPPPEPRKPVIEWIVMVVLLAFPIGLICRSSRRM